LKRILCLVFVLLLSGCGRKDDALDKALAMRQRLQGAACTFDCTVTADYGEKIHVFSMRCAADLSGDMTFEVVSPESISGITGVVSNDKGKLTFDDKALAFELLADGQFSPVSAPWILIRTLRGGYLTSCTETDYGMLLCIDDSYDSDPLRLDVRMDKDGNPISAEILWQGRRILSMEIENFQLQ
jgi:outer membrane lipoprotein-sorting protein